MKLEKYNIKRTLIKGAPPSVYNLPSTRAAALTSLSDNSIILVGGENGGTLYYWKKVECCLIRVGELIPQFERLKEARYGVYDIKVLDETGRRVIFLYSYPRLNKDKTIQVIFKTIEFNKCCKKIKNITTWYESHPKIFTNVIHHGSGKIAVIDKDSAYISIGDLGYNQINNRELSGDLGCILKITKDSSEKISQGHRNIQGMTIVNGKLFASEHGPNGGDEINLINKDNDYGWPFVSYGFPYGVPGDPRDYVVIENPGSHEGYTKPLIEFTPSIAPTELIYFNNYFYMGTLIKKSLILLKLENNQIINTKTIFIGHRLRNLTLLSNNNLVITTDDGLLLVINLSEFI